MMGRMKRWAWLVLWLVPVLGGCEAGLFPAGTARSPYERYMTLRGDYRPPVETDAYGIERPALRQRLAPLD